MAIICRCYQQRSRLLLFSIQKNYVANSSLQIFIHGNAKITMPPYNWILHGLGLELYQLLISSRVCLHIVIVMTSQLINSKFVSCLHFALLICKPGTTMAIELLYFRNLIAVTLVTNRWTGLPGISSMLKKTSRRRLPTYHMSAKTYFLLLKHNSLIMNVC